MFEWNQIAVRRRYIRLVTGALAAFLLLAAVLFLGAGPAFAVNHCGTQIKAKKTANANGQIYLPSGQPSCDSAAVKGVFVLDDVVTIKTSNCGSMASNGLKSVTMPTATDSTTVQGCSVNAPVSCTLSTPYSGTSWWTHN
ncbi:hypothetical protein [Demequina sp.]|uniref:hypothetical protein n=1 Tax=Demequina sp. TaxID=2050685 RepID=UPI003D125142